MQFKPLILLFVLSVLLADVVVQAREGTGAGGQIGGGGGEGSGGEKDPTK